MLDTHTAINLHPWQYSRSFWW